jgi:hypothetical protein
VAQPRRLLCPVRAAFLVGGLRAYGSANETVLSAKYDFVWCPEYHRKVLVGLVAERLREIIAEVAG